MQIVISPKYQVSYDFVLQIPIIFNVEGETVYQGRNTIKRFKTSNGEWIVKRYKKPNIIQRIAYTFFKKSKAERAYLYAQKLQSKNICTPEGMPISKKRNTDLSETAISYRLPAMLRPSILLSAETMITIPAWPAV